jgi:hypothetical protein
MGNIKYGNIGIIPCGSCAFRSLRVTRSRPARAALRKLLFRCKVNDMSYEL